LYLQVLFVIHMHFHCEIVCRHDGFLRYVVLYLLDCTFYAPTFSGSSQFFF